MSVQPDLPIEIESFLAVRVDIAATAPGRLTVNDVKFVGRPGQGCSMTLAGPSIHERATRARRH